MFADDSAKVTYTWSYLKGTALDWFEPSLTSGNDVSWLSDYSKFVSELRSHFGPFDPEGEAKAELENLHMRDNQRITKYLVKFNRLAARVQWVNATLRCQFYNGLLSQVKDEISRFGKPDNLQELQTLSQTIDACYWERQSEAARETLANRAPANQERLNDKAKTPPNPPAQTANKKGNSGDKPVSSSPNTSNTHTSGTPKPPSDLASKLGADGRLTQQERQRCMDQNLCLFCGKPSHMAKDCNKAAATKARAASATEDMSDSIATELKN